MKTMTTISEKAADAFLNGSNFLEATTMVVVDDNCHKLFLNFDCIAKRDGIGQIFFKTGKSLTNTKKDRLNEILSHLKQPLIFEKDGEFFWGSGEIFKGGWGGWSEIDTDE